MPVHLPPISRRQFLARAVVTTAGVVFTPELLAAERTDPNSWAFLSDTHLAADRNFVAHGINMTNHFVQVSRELTSRPAPPAGVFITGDCAFNSGESADYAVLAELLQPIRANRMPVHLALGNHDHRERFWKAFQEEQTARRPLRDRQTSLLSTKWANWFILDSLEITQATPGLLGREQLDWLAEALDANARKPALVLIHHNPGLEGGNMGLKDTQALLEVIRPRKQVKAYIYGHTHNWTVQQDSSGIHLINLPPVAYVFKGGNPSGWVHAMLQPDGMQLELRSIDPTHKAHGQVTKLAWRV